jgi:hypothetical protein
MNFAPFRPKYRTRRSLPNLTLGKPSADEIFAVSTAPIAHAGKSHCRRLVLRLWIIRQSWSLLRTRPFILPAFLAWEHRDNVGLRDRLFADDFPALERIGNAVDV